MAPIKEFELWNTYDQILLGKFRTQSNVMIGFYDQMRQQKGQRLDRLDIILQRPYDNPIYLISGRDERMSRWFASLEELGINLRLTCGTDVIGLGEFIEYGGFDSYVEDCSVMGKDIDFQRYEAVVSRDYNNGSGRGATEVEALARAMVDMQGGYDGLHAPIAAVCS